MIEFSSEQWPLVQRWLLLLIVAAIAFMAINDARRSRYAKQTSKTSWWMRMKVAEFGGITSQQKPNSRVDYMCGYLASFMQSDQLLISLLDKKHVLQYFDASNPRASIKIEDLETIVGPDFSTVAMEALRYAVTSAHLTCGKRTLNMISETEINRDMFYLVKRMWLDKVFDGRHNGRDATSIQLIEAAKLNDTEIA